MSVDWFFRYGEGLGMCAASGVLALVQPKAFIQLLAQPSVGSLPQQDITIFMTRLFGMTAVGFGMSLYLAIPELKSTTKKKLLSLFLLGDCAQICCAAMHPKTFGGTTSKQALSKSGFEKFTDSCSFLQTNVVPD